MSKAQFQPERTCPLVGEREAWAEDYDCDMLSAMCVHVYMYIYTHVCMYMCVCMRIYVCMHVRIYARMYEYMHACMYVWDATDAQKALPQAIKKSFRDKCQASRLLTDRWSKRRLTQHKGCGSAGTWVEPPERWRLRRDHKDFCKDICNDGAGREADGRQTRETASEMNRGWIRALPWEARSNNSRQLRLSRLRHNNAINPRLLKKRRNTPAGAIFSGFEFLRFEYYVIHSMIRKYLQKSLE